VDARINLIKLRHDETEFTAPARSGGETGDGDRAA